AQARVIEDALAPCEITAFDQDPETARRYYEEFSFQRTLTWPRDNERGTVGRVRWLARVGRLFLAATALRPGHQRLATALAHDRADFLALQTYADATLVSTPGGTMLTDNYNVVPRLADWFVPLALHRPLVVFTQSLDALEDRTSRFLARRVLR